MIDDEPRGPPIPHDAGPVVAANLQSGPASLPPLPPHIPKKQQKKSSKRTKKRSGKQFHPLRRSVPGHSQIQRAQYLLNHNIKAPII